VRLAVGLVAAAIPLVGVSAASAAIAGGNQFTSTDRPDLVSVTITGASSASFCFDKPITAVADVGGFYLGGYRADATTKSLTATASGNCVNANITTSPWFTFAQVGEGAVRTTGNFANRADSVALSGSNTGNGTRGLTASADLQGVSIVSGAPQQIAFTYDEPVQSSAIVGAGGFHYVTSGAIPSCPALANAGCDIASNSAAISATDPRTVIAQFPVGGVPIVTSAVRAYSQPSAVTSATNAVPDFAFDSAPAPGSAGVVTGVPALISAAYSRQAGAACAPTALPACVVVDYTFNEGVSVNNTNGPLAFFAFLSDGTPVSPVALSEPSGCNSTGTATVPPCTVAGGVPAAGTYYGSNTVRGIFPVTALNYDDYLTKVSVNGGQTSTQLSNIAGTPFAGCLGGTLAPIANCAVVSTTTGHPNTPGSWQVGGNTGGKGAGYSTAPDALFTSFDTLTNTIAVTFDSRVYAGTANDYQLLAADGSEIAGATGISACSPSAPGFPCGLPIPGSSTPGPGPMTVWVSFPSPAVQVGNGKALELRGAIGATFPFGSVAALGGNAFVSPGAPWASLQDIIAPASVATAGKHFAASSHWSHKRMTAKQQRQALAKWRHHSRHSR
jgi:hypothetical protein